ncbi:MAG: aminotransferase class III-fold pyridoxal phosphate-dependent enzyme [Woeseiaceae bacterium]|nr:aminotransferase class III-fold pyridoxal phosphate-dependent enzyme [Woeseiaceae bacterium]
MNPKSLLERRLASMGSAYRLFYDEPVHLVRGEGAWLFDADGRRYLDMYNNVPHVGHCHPRVVAAICDQARQLNSHTRYLHDNVVRLAERLTAKMPAALDTAMFCCTGSEANELALRIARRVTGATGIVVVDYAYHGNTQATYEISTDTIPPEEVPPWVATVPAPDTYRGPHRGESAGERYAAHVAEAIDKLQRRGVKTAAFVIDTIVSSSGVVAPPPGYLARVADIVRRAGGLFVADEVQPGFGRTGKNFWGFEAGRFEPDIVTMGKPMGNGHPLSAVVTRREIVDAFAGHGRYFNTFGGNPVSCAAGLAVLDVIAEEGLQQNALEVGAYLADGLWRLADSHECIGDVRGTGLFLAVELVADRETKTPATDLADKVVNGLRSRGVLTGSIGPADNILKLRSPLVLSKDDADYFLDTLGEVLPLLP